MPRVVDQDLLLPTLYLHFLDEEFRVTSGQLDLALASGNHNSEIGIALPDRFSTDKLGPMLDAGDADLRASLATVLGFLRDQGEMMVEGSSRRAGGFGPRGNYSATINAARIYFNLRTARPKSSITLDKKAFGIPESADLYLFVQNHDSVAYMEEEERLAFEKCIESLGDKQGDLQSFSIFLKVFYEGGFAYNEKRVTSASSYLPVNCGVAAMSVVPAFPGQSGIDTGYPFLVPPGFVPFADTVPVTIRAIQDMSPRHKRYGLCFTRCLMVWAGEEWASQKVLNYSTIAPHGGFYYLPGTLKAHKRLGGLVYAFGEDRGSLEVPANQESNATRPSQSPERPQPSTDRRVCTICLDAEACMCVTPCGHLAYCSTCGTDSATLQSRRCPVCRASVASVVRVY